MHWVKKFVGFKVVEYFIVHPSKEIYLKELAIELKISPASAKAYCDSLLADKLIIERFRGNLRLFKSNTDDFVFKELTRAYHLFKLRCLGIDEAAKSCTSLAIYGSLATGNFDERSDIDLLVLGQDSDIDKDRILEIQAAMGRDIQLTVQPYHKWEINKKEGDEFAENVLRNHILLLGVQL